MNVRQGERVAPPIDTAPSTLKRATQVIVVSSVMLTFISYWRTAAIVLCDLASTAYYIGGIVEANVGAAAPWFILGVMLFSYAVRSIYIESCSLFVRGGVYRVVKEAMGGFLAKLSVSALMFDYILTGPTSGVSAGQYIMGLLLDGLTIINPSSAPTADTIDVVRRWGAVFIACAVVLYFYRENLIGIHESSEKALRIMAATTVMALVMLIWCGATLAVRGPVNRIQFAPDLAPKVEFLTVDGPDRVTGEVREIWARNPETGALVPKMEADAEHNLRPRPRFNPTTGQPEDPLGFISRLFPGFAAQVRDPHSWFSLIGVVGLLLAFGHSILAMSGEETLAQVYREVESPKLPNFKKAAFIVFVYSLLLTASISFLAVLLIPDEVRMKYYADNLIGGLAMHVIGPPLARLLLNAFVVIVGFLILSGAVNTAMIGSNGVLNRVAEDGVLPDWFLKPHPRYGTSYRLLNLIVALQLFTIIASQGNMYILGEAYAFGVVWSFVFKAAAMVVLRFKDPSPREFKVPFNLRIGKYEVPIGLSVIFVILLATAVLNFFTKEVATIGGLCFTAVFLVTFIASERYHERKRGAAAHHHLEQFNERRVGEISVPEFGLKKPYRKLVAIRSPNNLFMLEKALQETDSTTTDVVVMTAKVTPRGDMTMQELDLDTYDQTLMTSVVTRAESSGKPVTPLIVPTNSPFFAVIQTAKNLQVQELIIGASNKFGADEQLEQVAFYWMNLCEGSPQPLTVRILSRDRDVYLDLEGGNRIPKFGEARARSVAELRAAGLGVRHILFVHFNTLESSDLFETILTMLDPQITLSMARTRASSQPAQDWLQQDLARAKQLRRQVDLLDPGDNDAEAIVQVARQKHADLIIISASSYSDEPSPIDVDWVVRHSPCRICVITLPGIPHEAVP
jgi:amino acid transporter/nucleotide-binding universal stress UspA family protein